MCNCTQALFFLVIAVMFVSWHTTVSGDVLYFLFSGPYTVRVDYLG